MLEGRADPRPAAGSQEGRSINLTLADRGWSALDALGLTEQVRRFTVPLYGRRIHHEDGTSFFQPYGSKNEAIHSIRRTDLNGVVLNAAESEPQVRIDFRHRCTYIDVDTQEIGIEDGVTGVTSVERGSPIIACDGAFSLGHRATRGASPDPVINVIRDLADVGYKELRIPAGRFGDGAFEPNALHLWPRGRHVLIAFPNIDGSMSCSLFLPHEGPFPSFATLETPEQVRALFERDFADALALMPTLYEDFFANPIGKLHTVRVSPWSVDGTLLLLGDSAHAMVPFIGQGLNCGFEDCATLAACIDRYPKGNWGPIFREFERLRKEDCDAVTQLALRHYLELSERVRDPVFLWRKKLEQRLYSSHADKLIPLYSMVTFSSMPYSAVNDHARQMDGIVDELARIERIDERWDTPEVQSLIGSLVASLGA
jgi:kynurenine 3-monooxygenase